MILEAVLFARRVARQANMSPYAVEIAPEQEAAFRMATDGLNPYAGLEVRYSDGPASFVLARPNRRIGRYEVVAPTRFAVVP